MLEMLEKNSQLILSDGRSPILEGIEILARLEDGQESALSFISMKKTSPSAASLVFRAADSRIEAQLEIMMKGNHAVVYVRAEIQHDEGYRDRRSFAANHGLVLRIHKIPDVDGLMANYQHKDWWTRPYFNKNPNTLPAKTLSLLWRSGQRFSCLLPICDRPYRADLCGSESGVKVGLSTYQGGFDRCNTVAFVLGVGNNPYALAEENVRLALEHAHAGAQPRSKKKYPEILDYLGWCSWDAFYHTVDANGLLAKTEELAKQHVPVRWVMIDDGWSEVSEDKKLRSFDAVASKFPQGLSAVIHRMKAQHSIRWVGVWHTIAGYWNGIDPEGELFAALQPYLYQNNSGAWIPAPEAAKGFGFWRTWHSFLQRQGVDFVKVDSQSAVANFLQNQVPIGKAASAAHQALEASAGIYFNGCIINCMGMSSENIWHRPASSVSRNSDDFVPEVENGFNEHALQNAYNSFFHGPLYWGDWDMYWTQNHDDLQNMTLRAISGGPIYISDKLGATNPAHIWPLIYRDGKIIRCNQPGLPTPDCITVDPATHPVPLKIWNLVDDTGTGVVAAFHVHGEQQAVQGSFGPSDIPEIEGESFLVFEYFSQNLIELNAGERRPFRLRPTETALFVFIPKKPGVTPIGLIDKMISPDAIEHCFQRKGKTSIVLREGGQFAFSSKIAPDSVSVNGEEHSWEQGNQPELYVIHCQSIETSVLIEIVCNEK